MAEVAEVSGALSELANVLNDVSDRQETARTDTPLMIALMRRCETAINRGDWARAANLLTQVSVMSRNAATQIEVALALERGARRIANQVVMLAPHPADRSTVVRIGRARRKA